MFGGSHTGLVQWLAMAEGAPGLAVIAPAFTRQQPVSRGLS